MVFRWGGHATNILKYKVPELTADQTLTDKFEILIDPEVDYKTIEVFLANEGTDGNFSLLESKEARHVTERGINVLVTSADSRWCVNCYVYLIVNIIEDRRIYVTTKALSENPPLVTGISSDLIANAGLTECV